VPPLSLCQLTQDEMAKLLGITRPRLNGLLDKEAEPFGIDALLAIAVRAGLTVQLQVTRTYRQ
jgi:predicted XRE-type DNA-binding protein